MAPPTDHSDLEGIQQLFQESPPYTICTQREAIATEGSDTNLNKNNQLQTAERTKIPRPSFKNTVDCNDQQESKEAESIGVRRIRFRKRKSLSLMEIQRHRKSSCPPKAIAHLPQNEPRNSVHSLAISAAMSAAVSSRGDTRSYERSVINRNDFYCFVSDSEAESEVDSKLAGMRVFASIMLNAWRRRRDEVRRLTEELSRTKKGAVKSKNQIHVISSLFKVEQKTNDDLSFRFRRSLDDQQKIQDMYDHLNKAFISLQAKCCDAEECLEQKNKECENLNFLLTESKSGLFKSMSRERELEMNVTCEQRKILELENEKNDLLSEIASLQQTESEKTNELQQLLVNKESEMASLKNQLDLLEKKLQDLKNKESLVKEYEKLDLAQRKYIEELTDRVCCLQNIIKNSWYTKTLTFLKLLPLSTLQYCHFISYCLLPMTPPPPKKFHLQAPLVIEKALRYRWS